MFIPAGVGVMTSWGVLQPILIPVSVVTVVALVVVMVAGGWSAQLVLRHSSKSEESERGI